MEWLTFLFGAVVGAFVTTISIMVFGFRFMKPYMKVARRKKATESLVPPVMWKTNEQELEDIWKRSTGRPKRGD